MLPVSRDGLLRLWEAFETADVEIENREFVFGEDIGIRLYLDAVPNVTHGSLEIFVDGRIKIAFGVARDINGALVIERAYAVDVGSVATHGIAVGKKIR